MTDEEMISSVLDDDSSENEQESSTPPIMHTVQHDDTMSAFSTCYKWVEGNNVQAQDSLPLKRLQEKIVKEAFRYKRQNY
jgi:hypothetical protein